ncbi:hypothetical protein RHSP_82494 [Rhizobium freirei PRF 81]|uniref:Secreted protein n=1 Tax=Rhizobium freirei PRF 81 TaxID=363754 RepID=N6UYQ4_9HYPH|nr:hypothetical protein RHSP_82494 [Rhizobium freirei PRF 81]
MSWVTRMTVVPNCFWMASRSSCALPRMTGSSAPKGSSISSTSGSAARARATPTRCCWPPESWLGYLAAKVPGSRRKRSRSSSTRRSMRAFSQPSSSGTVAIFCATVRCGNRPCPCMA